jgi:hypothetical protein
MKLSGEKSLWTIVLISYAVVITLSFLRIYVYEAFPIYYQEEDIPDIKGVLLHTFGL